MNRGLKRVLSIFLVVVFLAGSGVLPGNVFAADAVITPTTSTFSTASPQNITVTMTPNGNNLANIKIGTSNLVKGTDYTVSGNVVTLNSTYFNYYFGKYRQNCSLVFDFDNGADPTLTVTPIYPNSTISPTSINVNRTSAIDTNITLTLNGNSLTSIKNVGTTLTLNTHYVVSGSTVTLKKEYLQTLPVGSSTLTFCFNGGNNQTLSVAVIADSAITPSQASFITSTPSDITVTLSFNGNTNCVVKNGPSNLVLNTDYSISGSTVTIKKGYLSYYFGKYRDNCKLTFDFDTGADPVLTVVPVYPDSSISPSYAYFDKQAPQDINILADLKGNSLVRISSPTRALVQGSDYTVTGSAITLNKSFLSFLPGGETPITFTFNGGNPQILTVSTTEVSPAMYSKTSYQNSTYDLGANNNGQLTSECDVTPLTTSASAVIGYTGYNTAFADDNSANAISIRFNSSGKIDAANGSTFSAAASYPYTMWQKYHIRMVTDTVNKKYSVWVSNGGAETLIAQDYSYRASTVSDIGKLGLLSQTDSQIKVENHRLSFVQDSQAPTAPGSLALSSKTDVSATLSWNAVTSNTGGISYLIYKNGVNIGSSTGLSYTVSDLSPASSYTFTVRTKNAAGNISGDSNSLSVTTYPSSWNSKASWGASTYDLGSGNTGVRTCEFDVTPLVTTASGIIGYAASSTTVASQASNYMAVRLNTSGSFDVANGSGFSSQSVVSCVYGTTYHIKLVTDGTKYSAWVLANGTETQIAKDYSFVTGAASGNVGKVSLWSSSDGMFKIENHRIYGDTTAPTAPSSLVCTSKTDTQAVLSWTPSNDNIGVTGYDVYSGSTVVATAAGNASGCTVTGLSANTSYTFTVVAKDASGNVSQGSTIQVVTGTGNSAWYSKNGFGVAAYQLGSGNTGIVSTEFDFTPLTTGANGVVGYTGSNVNFTDFSSYTMAIGVDGSTGSFIVRNGTVNQLLSGVTFNYTVGTKYHIRMVTDLVNKKYSVWATPPNWTEMQIANNFAFRPDSPVISDLGKVGIWSSQDNMFKVENHRVYAGGNMPPSSSGGITCSVLTDCNAALTWNASQGAVWYSVYNNGLLVGTTTDLNFTVTGLSADTAYTLGVRVGSSTGISAESTAQIRTLLPTVKNAKATLTGNNVAVTWDPVAGASGYQIYKNNSYVANISTCSYSETNLPPNSVFTYKVIAYNAAGNVSKEGVATVSTNADMTISTDMTLSADTVYGNLNLTGGTLNLNGKKLTVAGNLTQSGGTVFVNGGRLEVSGDYNITGSTGLLKMVFDNDYVCVSRNFTTESNATSAGMLNKGTLEIKGDFWQKGTGGNSFAATGDHRVLFSGTKNHIVKFDTRYNKGSCDNKFGMLEVASEAEGLTFQSPLMADDFITNNVKLTGLNFASDFKLKRDELFNGDLTVNGGTLYLNYHKMIVTGSLNQLGGTVLVNGGRLDVLRNYNITGSTGQLEMVFDNDYVCVGESFTTESNATSAGLLNKGTLEIKGDFWQKGIVGNGFAATGDHRVLFSGTRNHIVKFDAIYKKGSCDNKFSTLEVTSEAEGLTFQSALATDVFIGNGVKLINLNLNCPNLNFNKTETLSGDVVISGGSVNLKNNISINGNLTISGGIINLNGYKLVVTGSLIQPGGTVLIDGGRLDVLGDYNITSIYGLLEMVFDNDYVCVSGNFTTESNATSAGMLNKGTLEIKGDF
ncbi:MAG TPA: X2-like carbohydrate binding domain-containing protein, partial [Clostridia bacterium]